MCAWRDRHQSASTRQRAFTLVELTAIVAAIALLGCVAVPALARSKTRTPAAGCLSNLRQLQVGWAMYADENNGVLMGNAPAGAPPSSAWCAGTESWSTSAYNTNVALNSLGQMARYTGTNLTILRCPGDVVPSANGFRLRSYSMNGQVGNSTPNYNPTFRTYQKQSDIVCPAPANLFVFCDEHPGSVNDGFLQVSLSTYGDYPDVPASYLENGCGFSFADGHAEIHKWEGTTLLIPVVRNAVVSRPTPSHPDPDWMWLTNRSACQ
jgi:prepilin-type processing-associated H-X9-DG protein